MRGTRLLRLEDTRRRALHWLAAACLLWAGCAGGQTGEEGGSWCSDGETPFDLGPETRELGAEFSGTYRVPLFWIDEERIYEHNDPSQAEGTELTVEVTRREGPARGYEACPGAAWAPVEIEVRTADGRLNAKRSAWLWFAEDLGDLAVLQGGLNASAIELGGGYVLLARFDANGDLQGHVIGPQQVGLFYSACYEARWQLPLSERPSDPRFASVPLPAELLDAIDGHQFSLDWGGGHRTELIAHVRSRSETACWNGPDLVSVSAGVEVELVDERGARVAATPVRLGIGSCGDAAMSCFELQVSGSGLVRMVGEDEALPELGFDDGGAWVAQHAFGIVSFETFTGGAAGSDGWYSASYSISIQVEDGVLQTPLLETTLVGEGGEEDTLYGSSATPVPDMQP